MFCISLLIVDKPFHLRCYCDKSVFRFLEGLSRIELRIKFNWFWSILIKKFPHVRNREVLPLKTRKWNLILNFFVRIDGVVLNGGQKVKLYRKSVLGNYLLELKNHSETLADTTCGRDWICKSMSRSFHNVGSYNIALNVVGI